MDEVTQERIRAILASGSLSDFVGLREGSVFDAKSRTPYDMESTRGRYELAKDVSSFANGRGGYIVVGLETVRLGDQRTEEVIALNLMPSDDFPVDVYRGVLNQYVYPRIPSLEIGWVMDVTEHGRGVGYIFIPSQEEDRKYFLTLHVPDDESPRIRQIVFGIAVREGDSSEPFSKEQLYRAVQTGRTEEAVWRTRIEEKIDRLGERPPIPSESPTERLRERIEDLPPLE
jgi:predicted HTH transcriptional regulator